MRHAIGGMMILVNSLALSTGVGLAGELADRFETRVHRSEDGQLLPYRILRPKMTAGERYPLVIFLHGAGERGDDNAAQLVHGVKHFATDEYRRKYPCFVIAPQCPKERRWVEVEWTADAHRMPEQPSEPLALVFDLIKTLQAELPVDADRIYITGLSMGGFGVWDALQRHPDQFAAAAPVCGGGDNTLANRLKDIPIWAFHGARDTVVKPHRSRDLIAAIEKAGGRPRYTEYPDVAHNSWLKAYDTPALYEWLFAQRIPHR